MTEIVLNYDHNIVGQETGYNCGPASAQMALSIRGQYVEEWILAQECGTHTGGTDYVGLIENCLDPGFPKRTTHRSTRPMIHPPPRSATGSGMAYSGRSMRGMES